VDAVPPSWRLMRLLDGFVTTQLLYVAAELRIAEVLADGPRSGAEIAATVGVADGPLVRVLRGLVVEDVLAEEDDGRFSLTPVGACLPALRGSAQARADLYYRAAPGLLDAVRAGGTAFEHVYGEPFFTHLEHDADHQAASSSATPV
jgi:Dimerisation domain